MNTATELSEMTAPMEMPRPALAATTAARGRWRDYYELTKPRMNMLILGTTTVGFSLAVRTPAEWMALPQVLIGTAFCAMSAAILNQVIERNYDALMDRTCHRPLPSGRVSVSHAMLMGIAAGIIGGLYLLLFVNGLTALLGSATLLSYVAIYTPMKRITTLNTIVGAVPGAIPPVMGWTAVTHSISLPALALFGILFVWQIPHFLAIAILYRDDYRRGGFKMLPVEDPELRATGAQILLYSAALFPVALLPAMAHVAGEVYLVASVVLGVAFFAFGLACATKRTRIDARRLFFASIIYLPVLLAVLMMDRL